MITVCVLGMHRSGTSCLAGSLQAAGLTGGRIIEYANDNIKGNRENQAIIDLNDKVLAHNHGTWYDCPLTIESTLQHREQRDRLIEDLNSQSPVWMFKDPRTVLTLKFWQQGIDNLQLVGTFRHPLKVAISLYQRQPLSIPLREGIKLWIRYNRSILEAFEEECFPLICFDLPQTQYLAKLTEIIEELNRTIPSDFQLSPTELTKFYESSLVHQKNTAVFSPSLEDAELLAEAESLYQELLKKSGLSVDPETGLNNLSLIPLEENSVAIAKAIEAQPDNPQLYYMLAKALKNEGELEKAIQRGLGGFPHKRLNQEAIAASKKALKLNPDSVDTGEQLSQLLVEAGQASEGISLIESMLKSQPNNIRLHIILGNLQRQTKDIASAILTYQKIIKLIPHNVNFYAYLSNLLIQDNRPQEALATCQKALELCSPSRQIYFSLGKVFANQQEGEQAIAYYQKAIQCHPESSAQIYFHLGKVFHQQSNLEEAQAAYQQAIDLHPQDFYGYLGLGHYYRQQQDWEQAIFFYQQAIDLDCSNPGVYFNLGQSLRELGKIGAAIVAYKTMLQFQPQHYSSYVGLGHCYRQQKNLEQAIASYQTAIDLRPHNPRIYFILGQILQEQGSLETAITNYRQAIDLNHPNLFGVYQKMGEILVQTNQIEKAKTTYQQALAIKPNHPKVTKIFHQL